MIVDRRTLLAGGVTLAAWPARAAAAGAVRIAFVDSRLPATRAFVAGLSGARVIDIAAADADLWREVRGFASGGERVVGLTRWSDWVALRGVLEDKKLRVRAETRIESAAVRDAALFCWEMS